MPPLSRFHPLTSLPLAFRRLAFPWHSVEHLPMREVERADQNGINTFIAGEFTEVGIDAWHFMSRLGEFTECPFHASRVFIENADDTHLLQLQDGPNVLSTHHPSSYDGVAGRADSRNALIRVG